MEDVTSPCLPPLICTESFLSDGALNVSGLSDNTSASTNKSQPNILKRRDFTPQGPIKNLPFSPSRFLNQKKLHSDMAVSCKAMDSQEESLCISTTEDSGIEIPSYDIDSLFTNPVTSTPKLKRRESAPVDNHSFEEVSHVGYNSIYSGGRSSDESKKVATTSDKVLFRSPLIRRFINESGPRTPTPFKFKFGKNSFTSTKIVEECKDRPMVEPSNRLSYRRWTYRSPDNTRCPYKRKARKALNMDSSCHDTRASCLHSTHKTTKSVQAFVNQKNINSSGFHMQWVNESTMNSTTMNGSRESRYCEVPALGMSLSAESEPHSTKSQPSFVCPLSSKVVRDVAYLSEMNEKLVRVACGLSEDQKAMTIAAKQCLRSMENVRVNDSSGIIPPFRRLSHRMLC